MQLFFSAALVASGICAGLIQAADKAQTAAPAKPPEIVTDCQGP